MNDGPVEFAQTERQLAFHPLEISADLELLICGQCFSVVARAAAGQHIDWHFDAAKKVNRTDSPFGTLGFENDGPL